jgi:hypothetical protein
MQIDPLQRRMRWALFLGVIAFYACYVLCAVALTIASSLLPSNLHQQRLLVAILLRSISAIAAMSIVGFYWRASGRRARLARGLCPYCGHDMAASPKMCEKCGREPPGKKQVGPPHGFPVIVPEHSKKDETSSD